LIIDEGFQFEKEREREVVCVGRWVCVRAYVCVRVSEMILFITDPLDGEKAS